MQQACTLRIIILILSCVREPQVSVSLEPWARVAFKPPQLLEGWHAHRLNRENGLPAEVIAEPMRFCHDQLYPTLHVGVA